jgi:hypothetical protein
MRNEKVMYTWASGDAFCETAGFRLYVKTAKRLPGYDRFIFTHDMSAVVQRWLEAEGFKVIRCKNVHFVMRDRHLYFYKSLKAIGYRYKFAVVTDCRDVLFQEDPANQLVWDYGFVVCEGFKHAASGFNTIEQFEFQRNVAEFRVDMGDKPVINGGTMFGNPQALADLFLNIWLLGMKTIGRCTDQAALNYLWTVIREEDTRYRMIDPADTLVCLTGEGVKVRKELGTPLDVEFVNGTVRRKEGAYCVVHQWDRLEFANALLAHYGLCDTINVSTEGA